MVLVLPEIVHLPADEAAGRDSILGLGDGERFGIVILVARIGLEHRLRLGVVGVDPVHRLLAGDILEP
jgi:hypothetical protein